MPPRKRTTPTRPSPVAAVPDPPTDNTTPESTPETTPESTANGNGTGGKRSYGKRVGDTDTGLSGGFAVASADEVPAIVRDRGRSNQFDGPVMDSFTKKFWDEEKHGKGGSWVSGHVDNLEAAEKQARNAATFLTQLHNTPIGVEIRKLPDNDEEPNGAGKIYFRGINRRERKAEDTKKAATK